ncbi:lysophospholipid acyltransferase family protein [Halioxenophilus aromaticivorans]
MQLVWLYRYRVHRRNVTDIRGHLIIANHPMLIDALFAMAYVRDVCCIVKPALAANPFTRLTIKAAGFKLANDDNLLQSACEALARGENLLIFPEGTRNEYDDQLAFKRGAANIAVMAQCPILPIVFYCSPRMLQKGEKWWQLPEQPAQIDIVIEPSLKVPECVDASLPRTRQYRLLTEFLIEYYRSRLADPVCEIAQYHRPKA